jgi:uncharacterized small protein (DUF1192 family)
MDAEDLLPLRDSDPLSQVQRQDLDPLSIAELETRVVAWEAEAARTRAKIAATLKQRASADALFKR